MTLALKLGVNFIRKRSILQSGSGWVVFPKIASYLTTRFAFSKRGRGSGIAPPVTLYRFVSGGGSWNGFEESAQVSSHLSREGDGHGHRHHPHRCHGLLALNLFGFQKKKKCSEMQAIELFLPQVSTSWMHWRYDPAEGGSEEEVKISALRWTNKNWITMEKDVTSRIYWEFVTWNITIINGLTINLMVSQPEYNVQQRYWERNVKRENTFCVELELWHFNVGLCFRPFWLDSWHFIWRCTTYFDEMLILLSLLLYAYLFAYHTFHKGKFAQL